MATSTNLIVLGLLLGLEGTVIKYLVWDFFYMPQTLYKLYSDDIKQAQALIHELIFLPLVAEITDAVIERKQLRQEASTLEVLSEPGIYVRVRIRGASKALSERFEIDRTFQGLQGSCSWVAISWLIAAISCVALFFVYQLIPQTISNVLIGVIIVSVLTGGVLLFFYFYALHKLVRILGTNRL